MTLTALVGLVGRAREAVRLSPPLPHHILFGGAIMNLHDTPNA